MNHTALFPRRAAGEPGPETPGGEQGGCATALRLSRAVRTPRAHAGPGPANTRACARCQGDRRERVPVSRVSRSEARGHFRGVFTLRVLHGAFHILPLTFYHVPILTLLSSAFDPGPALSPSPGPRRWLWLHGARHPPPRSRGDSDHSRGGCTSPSVVSGSPSRRPGLHARRRLPHAGPRRAPWLSGDPQPSTAQPPVTRPRRQTQPDTGVRILNETRALFLLLRTRKLFKILMVFDL